MGILWRSLGRVVFLSLINIAYVDSFVHAVELPILSGSKAINSAGQFISTSTRFNGGASVDGASYYAYLQTVPSANNTSIQGIITVDPADVGKQADLLYVVGFEFSAPFDGGSDTSYVTISETGNPYNLDLYNEPGVWMAQLKESPFQREIILQDEMVINDMKGWSLGEEPNNSYYFFGYRLQDGTVVYTATPVIVTVVSKTTNSPPVADSLSSPAHSGEMLQINLLGSDPDGDTLVYELLSSSSAAYDSVYIQGNVLYVQMSNTFDSIGSAYIEYRVTDGQQFSQPATVTLQASTTEEKHGLGLKLTDPYDYSHIPRGNLNGLLLGAAGGLPTLPRRVDLSDSFPVAGNQGNQSSCVGWATAYALKSYQERMEEGWSLVTSEGGPEYEHIFSPAFIYNQINGGEDEGSYPNEALQLIVDKGAATLATMPYDDSNYWTQPSGTAFAEAAKFKGARVEVADGTLAIKEALANRLPVVAGILAYDSLSDLSGTDAVYNTGGACTPEQCGGHAVTIVGYDDDKFGGAFKIINSWGRDWGDNGYFWLPYDFARKSTHLGSPVLSQSLFLRDSDNTGTVKPTPNPTPILEDLPNLQVEGWSASYDERPGGTGELQYSIINTGTASVAENSVDVNLMLSTDSEISSNDIYVVYETLSLSIGMGESVYRDQNNSIAFSFPAYISAGTYYMGVWVDDLNRVEESNENDNFASGEQMVNIQDTLPDLVVRSWYAEWDDVGNGLLEYEVANEGVTPTRLIDWGINLVLSSDEIIGNGDEWVLFYERGNYVLEPQGFIYRDTNSRANFQLYVDAFGETIPEGTYSMALWIDDLDQEQESDEYNNYSLGNELIYIGDSFSSFRSRHLKENYNGKPLPKKVALRKVQLLDTPDGKRRVKFLEEELKKPLFDKQQRSTNQVVFPTTRRSPLPTEIIYGHAK